MNIVIVGAGDIGLYIASLLSKEEHNVIVIDKDPQKLDYAVNSLDVAVREGSGTDWQVLESLMEPSPHLFLALTQEDETNLVACSLAKNLGYPQTIARVRQPSYLGHTPLDICRIFSVDHLIGPELLVANEIYKSIGHLGATVTESFAHGAIQMRTLKVPPKWRKAGKRLCELELPKGTMVGLIHRRHSERVEGAPSEEVEEIIFPHGNDVILVGDEVTFIGETEAIFDLHLFFGIPQNTLKSAVIIGGSLIGFHLAKMLEDRKIRVTLIDNNLNKCESLSERLPNSTVLFHDGLDLNFLEEQKVGSNDVFVACTRHDEVNVLASMLGKQLGCSHVIASISNTSYVPMLADSGISHTVSPRLSAANRILSVLRSETVSSMASLYNNQARIMELKVSMDSKIAGIPIAALGPQLPKDFLIAVIQNRGRIMIANGNRVLCPGDTVIAISSPRHINELSKVF